MMVTTNDEKQKKPFRDFSGGQREDPVPGADVKTDSHLKSYYSLR